MKEELGKEIAKRVKDGDVIGIGTGSTADCAIKSIGERIKNEGISVKGLTTSLASALLCAEYNIDVLDPLSFDSSLDWGFDGADEVDPKGRLIKGRGGAMLMEKIVASRCKKYIIIVDESKIVKKLGDKCAIPVEIIPQSIHPVKNALRKLGAKEVILRFSTQGKYGPVISDAGNIILDVKFSEIPDSLEDKIKQIPGVVDSGLFLKYANEVLIYKKTEIEVMKIG